MSLEFYEKNKTGLAVAISLSAMLILGFVWGYEVGYPAGMNDVPEPEYQITSYSMRMNATYYNYTYYDLTKNDMKSDLWKLEIEPRDNYFMFVMSITAKSDNWSDFIVRVEPMVLSPNITTELISIQTHFSPSSNTYTVNFYGGAYGGIFCSGQAFIYFLGYGDIDIEGIDIATAGFITIEGRFG